MGYFISVHLLMVQYCYMRHTKWQGFLKYVSTSRIAQNVLVWFVFYILLAITAQADEAGMVERLIIIFGLTMLIAAPIYALNLMVIPLWQQKRWWLGGILLVVSITGLTLASEFIIGLPHMIYSFFTGAESEFPREAEDRNYLNVAGTIMIAMMCGAAFKGLRDSYLQRTKNQEAELRLLKGQLNPHFLFNTLNNLYGLAVIKSDKLPGLMLQLSDLLRYSLYDTKTPFVPLEKEVTYLRNYVDLEGLRLDEQVKISWNQTGWLEGYTIAPMLLIVFVENAFKHLGSGEYTAAEVLINIKVEEGQLHFSCRNSKDENLTGTPRPHNVGGIGLANANKRLEMVYPNRYDLRIINDKQAYTVTLDLQLDEVTELIPQ